MAVELTVLAALFVTENHKERSESRERGRNIYCYSKELPVVRYLLSLITLSLVAPSLLGAEVWRCEGDTFTTRPASGCARLEGSRVCVSGQIKFYTPQRAGLTPESSSCASLSPSLSPFVGAAAMNFSISGSGDSAKMPWNWGRKLQPTLALAPQGKSMQDEFAGQIMELQQYLSRIPGGARVLEALNKSK